MVRRNERRRDAARTGPARPGPLVLLLAVLAVATGVAAAGAGTWWPAVVAVAAAVAVVVIAAWRLGAASTTPAPVRPVDDGAPRTDLIAAVSHDLRTPLATIGAYVELLEAGDAGELSGEARQMLHVVEENVQRAYAMADDLVDLRGQDPTAAEPVPVADVAHRAVRAIRPAAAERRLAVDTDLDALADAKVTGHAAQLDRVLVNLLANAVKFTPEGGSITVRGALGDGVAVLSVSDTGDGIPGREQQRIFERYYRADAARAGRVPGSGLGLAIVRELVAQHGGTVDVRSRPGQGATFTLTLPLVGSGAAGAAVA